MWRYVDWEGDGDQDLIVGIGDWTDYAWDHAYDRPARWRNGPLHGWVYLIENVDGKLLRSPGQGRSRRLAGRCLRLAEPEFRGLRWRRRPRSALR